MTVVVPESRWSLARAALRSSADAFLELLKGDSAAAMATKDWTVADTAAHVTGIALMYVTLVDEDVPSLPIPGLAEMVDQTTVDTVADLNAFVLRHFPERDTANLAAALDYAVGAILDATRDVPAATPVPWLGESLVTIAGMVAHLVNELLVHGRDIAIALRRPWVIPEDHAGLYWELFFVGMLGLGHGSLLDTNARMPGRRIAVSFRSAHAAPSTIVLENGHVRVASDDEPYDVRVTFRPAGFNLMMFGRVGTLAAALRRDVVVGGPRPWLLRPFLRIVHMPNPKLAAPPKRSAVGQVRVAHEVEKA